MRLYTVCHTMQHAGNWSYQLDNNQNLQCVKFSTCFSLNDLFCFLWTAFLRTDMVKALFLIFSCTPQNNSGLGQHPNRNLTTMWVHPLHLAVQGVTLPNIHWGISDLVGCAGMWVEPFLLKTVLLPSFSSGLAIWKQDKPNAASSVQSNFPLIILQLTQELPLSSLHLLYIWTQHLCGFREWILTLAWASFSSLVTFLFLCTKAMSRSVTNSPL